MVNIKIFNSAYRESEVRNIPVQDVNVITMRLDYSGVPYMLFEHEDYPLGALRAQFNGQEWECDLD